MEVVYQRCCGIDVHSYYLTVSVLYVTSCNANYGGVHILFVKEELQKSTRRRKSYGWQ